MTRLSGSRREGFTLLEIAVAVAILAVLGAVVYPALASSMDRKRVTTSIAVLRDLTSTLDRYDTLLHNLASCSGTGNCDRSSGRYPLMLSHMIDSITTGGASVTGVTSCLSNTTTDRAYTRDNPTPLTGWRNNGPFFDRDFARGVGFRIPIGLVRDTLVRSPRLVATSTAARQREYGILQIQVDSILAWDLREMKMLVDGYLDGTQGTVRWTAVANSDSIIQPVFWAFPIGGC